MGQTPHCGNLRKTVKPCSLKLLAPLKTALPSPIPHDIGASGERKEGQFESGLTFFHSQVPDSENADFAMQYQGESS
jgi:hypothetical protein